MCLIRTKIMQLRWYKLICSLHTWANLNMCKFTWNTYTYVKVNLLRVHMHVFSKYCFFYRNFPSPIRKFCFTCMYHLLLSSNCPSEYVSLHISTKHINSLCLPTEEKWPLLPKMNKLWFWIMIISPIWNYS